MTDSQPESSKSTGPTSGDGETCGRSRHEVPSLAIPGEERQQELLRRTSNETQPKASGGATSSQAGTHAKKTATPARLLLDSNSRPLAVSSSGSLMFFGLGLFSGRILQKLQPMLPGLGSGFDVALSRLVTLLCPSDCEPVALALSISGKGCSCSPCYPTPCKRDHKGQSSKKWRERSAKDARKSKAKPYATLPDAIGGCPHPEFVEELMGFPIGYTDLDA